MTKPIRIQRTLSRSTTRGSSVPALSPRTSFVVRSHAPVLKIPGRNIRLPLLRLMSSSASKPSQPAARFTNIIASRPEPSVGLITLNRPKALNALSTPLFKELNEAMRELDEDPEVGAIVITGSEKAFAAGADIKEMKDKECE